MDQFFKVQFILERAKFNRRFQKEGGSADEYITALYNLVETCNYRLLKDEMIRDRLVVGIRDSTLSEKLQLNAELTLETAKKEIRLSTTSRNCCKEMQLHHCTQKDAQTRRSWWYKKEGRGNPGAKPPKGDPKHHSVQGVVMVLTTWTSAQPGVQFVTTVARKVTTEDNRIPRRTHAS